MVIALLVARLVLAAVFAVAGLAKLADRAGTRQALRNFGLPAMLAAPLGVLLPLAELAVAVALVPRAAAWWGAAGALALLLLFIAGIGINLARGRKPDCHCFGQIYSAPIGWPTLARNAALAAVAGFVVWQGREDAGRSAVGWLGGLTTAERLGLGGGLLALGLLAAMGWLLVHLVGQHGRLLLRLEEMEARLAVGAAAAGGNVAAATPAPAAPTAPRPGCRSARLPRRLLSPVSTARRSCSTSCAPPAGRCCWSSPTPAAAPATPSCRRWAAGSGSWPAG